MSSFFCIRISISIKSFQCRSPTKAARFGMVADLEHRKQPRTTVLGRPRFRIDVLSVALSHYNNFLCWQGANFDDVHA